MPRLTIKTKFMTVITVTVVAFVAFNAFIHPAWLNSQIQTQSSLSARQVALSTSRALSLAMSIKSQERPDTQGQTDEIIRIMDDLKNIPKLSFAALFREDGKILESTAGTPPWILEYKKAQGSKNLPFFHEQYLIASAPIYLGKDQRETAGQLVLGFSQKEARSAVRKHLYIGLGLGLSLMVIGLFISLYLDRRYIQAIRQLTLGAEHVAAGNLEAPIVQVRTGDELEKLSQSFELMTQKLRTAREEIERQNRLLEFRVQERTRQLMESIWELEETRSNLEQTVQERTKGLEQSRTELKAWADTLEEKVNDKTLELTALNDSLLQSFQKLQEVDRLKDEFLANMSHELRTPLNAVIGFSGLLIQDSSDRIPEDVKEDLEIILQNGQGLLSMIDSILDLSKIEAGTFDLEMERVDLVPILEEVKALSMGLLVGKPIDFMFNLPPTQLLIEGDPVRLKQVFMNLIGNAIKFTEHGHISLSVQQEKRMLRIAIKDTGIGMSDEEMSRLFRPFQQVDGSITRRFGGTGLGLALSQKLMGLMRGQISVESRKGIGSTFFVEIPFENLVIR